MKDGGEIKAFLLHHHGCNPTPLMGAGEKSRWWLYLCKGLCSPRELGCWECGRKDTPYPALVVSTSPTLGMIPKKGRLAEAVS